MLVLPLVREIQIQRPVDSCFRYLADFATSEQWDPGVRRAEKLTPGAPREGSRFALRLDVLGREVPADYELRELHVDHKLVLSGSGPGFQVTDRMEFIASSRDRTRLRYQALMELDWAPAAMRPVLGPWGERLADAAMRGLISALEQDGPEMPGAISRLAERLVLPGFADYTRRGYRQLGSRGLSRRLDGKTVAITGATGGLGLATAQLLGRLGARLLLIGRGADRLATAAQSVRDFAGDVELRTLECELSSLVETRRLAQRVLAEEAALDVWINNAGALFAERGFTDDGYERSLAINLLSPALLSRMLSPALRARRGRIINMVSGGLYLQGLRLDDLDYREDPYDGAKAYARAKRGLLALTQHWARQVEGAGLTWQAVHPGWAATPGVARSLPRFDRILAPWLRDARMGADTIAWLASHPLIDDPRYQGGFWFDRAQRPSALLPGTTVDSAQLAELEARVLERIGPLV